MHIRANSIHAYRENSYTDKSAKRPICVYFLNNELIEWGPGEDWQADQAFKDRVIERYQKRHPKK